MSHGERLTALEKSALVHISECPTKQRVENVEQQVHDAVVKRALMTSQIKVLWSILLLLVGSSFGAYCAKYLFK